MHGQVWVVQKCSALEALHRCSDRSQSPDHASCSVRGAAGGTGDTWPSADGVAGLGADASTSGMYQFLYQSLNLLHKIAGRCARGARRMARCGWCDRDRRWSRAWGRTSWRTAAQRGPPTRTGCCSCTSRCSPASEGESRPLPDGGRRLCGGPCWRRPLAAAAAQFAAHRQMRYRWRRRPRRARDQWRRGPMVGWRSCTSGGDRRLRWDWWRRRRPFPLGLVAAAR